MAYGVLLRYRSAQLRRVKHKLLAGATKLSSVFGANILKLKLVGRLLRPRAKI